MRDDGALPNGRMNDGGLQILKKEALRIGGAVPNVRYMDWNVARLLHVPAESGCDTFCG